MVNGLLRRSFLTPRNDAVVFGRWILTFRNEAVGFGRWILTSRNDAVGLVKGRCFGRDYCGFGEC